MDAAPLRQRNFALLWTAGLISITGDWALRIALPIYVLLVTGSIVAVSAVVMAGVLPTLLVAPLAGVWVDRWDRRNVMLVASLAQGVLLLPLLGFDSSARLWIVFGVAFAQSALVQFFQPAEAALLPRVVATEQLTAANSLNALNNNLGRLIGPMVGGLSAYLGLASIVVIDMATFFVAALLIALVKGSYVAESHRAGVVREFVDGLRTIRRSRVVTGIIVLFGITSLGEGVMATLFAPFVAGPLHGGAREISWLMSAQAVGGVLGGFIGARIKPSIPPARLVAVGLTTFGLIDVAIFNYPRLSSAILPEILMFALVGIPSVISGVGLMTLLQTEVVDARIGRVFSVGLVVEAVARLAGAAIAGSTGTRLGIINVLTIQGLAYVVAGMAFLAFTLGAWRAVPSTRRESGSDPHPAPGQAG